MASASGSRNISRKVTGLIRARTMLAVFVATVLLLAACSRSTVYTLDADILSFTNEAERQGEISALGDFRFPDEDGASSSELGLSPELARTLERLSVDLAVSLTSTAATGDTDVSLDFHIAEDSAGNPFDETPLGSGSVTLAPGESDILTLQFEVSEAENPDLLNRLQAGDFSLGIRLQVTSTGTGSVDYRLERLQAALAVRPGALFSF